MQAGYIIVWAIWVIYTTIALSYYLQLKEYRWDRVRDFFQHEQGLKQILKPSFKRPKPTKKLALLIVIGLTITLGISTKIGLLASAILHPINLAIATIITNIPTGLIKKQRIKQAKTIISLNPNLITIGITGSYGKSSTKDYLGQILQGTAPTLVTPGNTNTEIGIARLILKSLKSEQKYFVVEMGAYRPGEIKIIAEMVKPQIGIITAIAPQHLSLFKTIDAIKKTKAELVQNLQANGKAILNYDNKGCREIGKDLQTAYYYSTNPQNNCECQLLNYDGQQAKIRILGQELTIYTKLPAPHFLGNLLAAILASHLAGIPLNQLAELANNLELTNSHFQIYKTANNVTVIDDSYNSNPTGFKAAIELLAKQEAKRKFIVTRGMAELGSLSEKAHTKIAELINSNEIQCFVLTETAHNLFGRRFTAVTDLKKAPAQIFNQLESGDAILLENRVPEKLKQLLKPEQ